MKSQFVLLSAIGLAAATQHRHGHQHVHEKKEASPVADVTYVPGPTVVMYSLNGQTISEADVMEGIKNGTLVWANGAPSLASSSSSSSVYSAPSTSSVASSTTFSTSTYVAPSTTSTSTTSSSSSSSVYVAPSSSAAATTSAVAQKSYSGSSSSSSSGIDQTFPDGEIDCSDFPSDYGAVSLSYLGLGGWSGIQDPQETLLEGFADILTIATGQCTDGSCCSNGRYCSYACPAGYQKSQWPSTQGSTGQSVGGLLCKGGKLYKTNEDYDQICIKGSEEVTVLVRNEMGKDASVCRTDYPGMFAPTTSSSVAFLILEFRHRVRDYPSCS